VVFVLFLEAKNMKNGLILSKVVFQPKIERNKV